MQKKDTVNSNEYWDKRFNTDWESYEGPRQSRFFANIAIRHTPQWFIDHIRRESLTLVDWGCAQGDGTDSWASYIDAKNLFGVDFSEIAVQQAQQRYPNIQFLQEDWMNNTNKNYPLYDIVFSSNTLEHFHNAYGVLDIISKHAKKAVLLALPYKEIERIEEHFYSFLPENIPITLNNGFRLIWSKVVSCTNLSNTLWGGDQIILIYSDLAWIDSLKLSLTHCLIEREDSKSILNSLQDSLEKKELSFNQRIEEHNTLIINFKQIIEERSSQIATLNQIIEERNSQIATLNQIIEGHNAQIVNFNQIIEGQNKEVSDLNNKVSKINQELENQNYLIPKLETEIKVQQSVVSHQHQEIMNISNWASGIHSSPFYYGVKKYFYTLAKFAFNFFPLTHQHKYKIKQLAKTYLKKSKNNISLENTYGNHSDEASLPSDPLWKRHFLNEEVRSTNLASQKTLISGRDIYIFSVIDWDFRTQRPQHLARSLSKAGHRVFFFSNHFIDSSEVGYQIHKLDAELELYQIKLNVSGAPAIYFSAPDTQSLNMLKKGIRQFMLDFASVSGIALIQHAYWYDLAFVLPNTLRIYDCMDHHEGFGNVPEELIQIEKNLLIQSDLIITTSDYLDTFAQKYNHHVSIIRNAGEYEHFCSSPTEIFEDTHKRKIIGYFGAIAEWFDIDLIKNLAQSFPDTLILLVGNDTVGASKALNNFKNVLFTGEVPYSKIPYYLHAFDVCILPFLVTPLTLATNPVKIYEYLAAGKPVVSIDLPETVQFEGLISRAKNHTDFVAYIGHELSNPSLETNVIHRLEFAKNQTWDHRADTLCNIISTLEMPKISVIVLTYNNIALTRDCLKSLVQWGDYPNLEIIIVDNASTDGSQDFLKEFEQSNKNVYVILNEENSGFAAGNNIGLRAATGDYIVILNNDTVITPGCFLTMMRHLQRNPHIGLIGPTTNNIGNEAKISIEYSSFNAMLPQTFAYTSAHMGKTFLLPTAAFFCVMMPRHVFDRVGFLDENFGLGFFEDDDYCRRIEQLGLTIVCAEDAFVHHHLSASFNKLNNSTRQTLFDKNKTYYESKWGVWKPHEYRN